MTRNPTALYEAWQLCCDCLDTVGAHDHAVALLKLMRQTQLTPDWTSEQRAKFLNWCDQYNLFQITDKF